MARGQKWGTVGAKKGIWIQAWMTPGKRETFKKLAASKNLTVSAYLNKLVSLELIRAGLDDPSLSIEL